MKKERRQPTRAEWARITSRRPVVRRILAKAETDEERLGRIASEELDRRHEDEERLRQRGPGARGGAA